MQNAKLKMQNVKLKSLFSFEGAFVCNDFASVYFV